MKLYQNATRIDLNSGVHFLATPTQGAANERRTNDLFATHGLSATRRFSSMRATLQRQSQNQNFLLSRSVSLHGLRPVNPPRIPSRYRKSVCEHSGQNSITPGFVASEFPATHWPTPTKSGLGKFMPTSPKPSSPQPQNSTPTPTWDSIWKTRYTPWIQRPSICVSRCFHGQLFAEPSRLSRCIRC